MILDFILSSAILAVVAIGHFGLWIWLFNRINATGLRRKTIKRIEKSIMLVCVLIPIGLLVFELRSHDPVIFFEPGFLWGKLSLLTIGYSLLVCLFAIALAPFWIADRPQFSCAKDRHQLLENENLSQLQHPKSNAALYISGRHFGRMAKLPGNQIVSLQRNTKRLWMNGLPEDLIGLRIAHLSDVHLTGQLSTAFYRLAIDWVSGQAPDLIVLSGDIVDYQEALTQIRPVFDGLCAPLGMYFILGNHDKRLTNPTDVCSELCTMGWTDLGQSEGLARKGTTSIRLVGNELPWFRRHALGNATQPMDESIDNAWKLGVSHSPDQFAWGIANRCKLLLCGHTHGGQIRLPILGPIIAPSRYGTRYASGVFFSDSTVMHVSRGISGVHPYRWGCIPEVSVLELAPHDA